MKHLHLPAPAGGKQAYHPAAAAAAGGALKPCAAAGPCLPQHPSPHVAAEGQHARGQSSTPAVRLCCCCRPLQQPRWQRPLLGGASRLLSAAKGHLQSAAAAATGSSSQGQGRQGQRPVCVQPPVFKSSKEGCQEGCLNALHSAVCMAHGLTTSSRGCMPPRPNGCVSRITVHPHPLPHLHTSLPCLPPAASYNSLSP
jgi:hypothetical protein